MTSSARVSAVKCHRLVEMVVVVKVGCLAEHMAMVVGGEVCVCLGVRLEATVVQLLDISHAGPFIYRRRRRRRRCRRRHPLLYSGGYGCQQFWRQMGEEEDDRSPSIAGLRGMIAYRSHILWACALSALLR